MTGGVWPTEGVESLEALTRPSGTLTLGERELPLPHRLQRHLEQVRIVVSAPGVAVARELRKVLGGNVTRHVAAVEARGVEFGQPGVGLRDRALECVEILVDQQIGIDLAR